MPRADHVNPYKRRDYSKEYAATYIKLPPTHAAWVKTTRVTAVQVIIPEEINTEAGEGATVLLHFPVAGRMKMPFTISITNMTEVELDALERLIVQTFEIARPVVQHRDRITRERLAAGDDSDRRSYRQVPEDVVRPWAKPLYRQGVLDGSAWDAWRNGPGADLTKDLRGDGSELADADEAQQGTQDDAPTPDVGKVVGPVRGPGSDSGGLSLPDPLEEMAPPPF